MQRGKRQPTWGLRDAVPYVPGAGVRVLTRPALQFLGEMDRPHRGVMRNSLCIICFGWVDDPRHNTFPLVYADFPLVVRVDSAAHGSNRG